MSPSSANEACSRLRLPAETLTALLVAPPKCCSLRDVTLLDADSRDNADTKLLVMLVAALQAHTAFSPACKTAAWSEVKREHHKHLKRN